MQMKYLSLALAAALATTLTACGGSDNKSNYNKDTLTPVKPDVKPDGGDGNVKPDGGDDSNVKPNPDKEDKEDKEEKEEEKDPKPPKGDDTKNNVGDAANPGNITKDNVVVAQNYIRGDKSSFDRSNNASEEGNASVLGFNQLNNTYMSNVVVSRVLQPGETDKYTTLYLGQTPADAGKNTWSNAENTDTAESINSLVDSKYNVEFDPAYVNKGFDFAFNVDGDIAGSLENTKIKNPSLQTTNLTKISDSNFLFRDINNSNVGSRAYNSGIVTIKSAGKSFDQNVVDGENASNLVDADFVVRGQEDQIWTLDNKGNVKIIHETGAPSDNRTRIFGSLSHEDDVPKEIWNGKKFVANPNYDKWTDVAIKNLNGSDYSTNSTWKKTLNSAFLPKYFKDVQENVESKGVKGHNQPHKNWENKFNAYTDQSAVFDSFKNSYQLTPGMVEGRIKTLQNVYTHKTATHQTVMPLINQGGVAVPNPVAVKVLDKDVASPFYSKALNKDVQPYQIANKLISTVMNPRKIHLNYAQYGRVSSSIDKLNAVQDAIEKKRPYHQFVGSSKYSLQDNRAPSQQAPNTITDFYYARGLQPTTDMPKTGKYQYLGHALAYGLDNSFHGGVDNLDSNALIDIARSGTGNYVAAELDAADKSVKGKIYNVWTVADSNINAGATEDILISFGGKLNDTTNSVIGEAYRPYIAKDTKAIFKGAFFGPDAAEFAGNINTVEEGYGDAKWGAVFGAQKVGTPITINFENAVEKEQN